MHVQHMEKTVVKYVKGLQRTRQDGRKGTTRNMGLTKFAAEEYDIKHGVTSERWFLSLQVRNQSAFSESEKVTDA